MWKRPNFWESGRKSRAALQSWYLGRNWKRLKGVQITIELMAGEVWIGDGMVVVFVVEVRMVLALLLVGWVCPDWAIVERKKNRSVGIGHW